MSAPAHAPAAAVAAAAPARKVKFVASDPARGGLPVKRKQVQQACASCRRKKRRCIHADGAVDEPVVQEDHRGLDSSPSHSSPTTIPSLPTPRVRAANLSGDDAAVGSQPAPVTSLDYVDAAAGVKQPSRNGDSTTPQSSRFVGDLNPEGMFLEATASTSARQQSQKGDVGIWLSSAAMGSTGQMSQFITSRPPAVMDRFLLPFVREHCLSSLPPEEDFARLRDIFVQKIHPIFPVVPEAVLQGRFKNPCHIVLRQLICLAAGADPEMSQHLHLQNKGSTLLSPQEFSQSLSSAVRAILETSIITDRVLHIQALIMLSLYTQPTCPEEADLPAQLGGRAIHHIQTLGLHLLRYDAPNCDDLNNLFCAVWALDRINAAVYGRPCLIHERDIGADLEACIRKRPPCFRLFLSVVQWLDQVVELYRPGPSAEASGLEKIAYIDLPVLEAMIVNADALKVPSPLIVPRDHLSPMPFVPYAVSLALSVEYRKMRHSRLPMFRARSMNAFRRNCEMLRKFGDHFWSANVVAGLGERVLKEMERAATTLTREASPLPADGSGTKTPVQGQDNEVNRQSGLIPGGNLAAMNSAIGMDNAVDFSLIDAISGQDVFGHIDPNFNLDAVEDALEANLDIGLPLNWGDWGQFAT
ncbi:fungal specific transcription factor [Purpureocillium lavendulum]|uniref:Fungal specific transcription factor n=1 Tax=Purpureocillium lavendulum TaxID=1247861 RepID=A0AB34FPH5_9HYPO|nr:fungal specific transcription factor [Purpureocillium lavendulum]